MLERGELKRLVSTNPVMLRSATAGVSYAARFGRSICFLESAEAPPIWELSS